MNYLWWGLVFSTGAAIGSFLNVCIYRMPAGESVAYPPSHCPACRSYLRFFDLIPILSYLFLKGKCRYCGSRIAWQYPAVEFVTGVLFVLALVKYGITMSALRSIVLFSVIVPALVIDLRHKIIPDKLNFAGFILGIPLALESKEVLFSCVIGFLAGGGLLLLIAMASRGGMGGGDIKLAAVLGLLLGWKLLLVALFLAFVAGSIVGLAMLLLKMVRLKEPIPFGPYLALGAMFAALAGDKAVMRYAGFW
ncbi:prepilin peptidase [Pelotomaculum isophthalicicum JI]|uniref:Prepilin peptidase n=1 Tax=Pelotomaculum isophthalicicum JI TaxID=947010 RepID=A0A9X4H0E5_9FIRM|nr:A24 family peptidase [Pelotomaculum isophthalicicum]MDF9409770.1 prepilin peptidase [Pelotomaculum isophthalicicum JI]